MPYKIECPFCAARIEVPDELDNTTSPCPSCNQEIYLTREEAVEDLDPALEAIRRQTAAADKSHREELRQVMMMQERSRLDDARSKKFVNAFLWIFLWGPLCAIGGYLLFMLLFRFTTGHW